MADENTNTEDRLNITEWPFIYPLRLPIQALGEEYSALTLSEPTGTHVIKHKLLSRGLNEENFVPILCDLTGVPEASLLKMAAYDVMQLSTRLAIFFDRAGR